MGARAERVLVSVPSRGLGTCPRYDPHGSGNLDDLLEPSVSDLLAPIERSGEDIPADTASPLMQLGRYEVLEWLATGAFGFVLRAFDPVFRRPCALKVPHPNVLAEPGKRQRFLGEARALARLSHPAPHP